MCRKDAECDGVFDCPQWPNCNCPDGAVDLNCPLLRTNIDNRNNFFSKYDIAVPSIIHKKINIIHDFIYNRYWLS